MTVIGHIREKQGISGEDLHGEIATLSYSFRFRLLPMPKTANENSPSYRAVSRNQAGIEVDIGMVWIKTLKRGPNEGDEFLTLTFDDPSFASKLNVAAFKNSSTGDWDIMFRRRQDQAA